MFGMMSSDADFNTHTSNKVISIGGRFLLPFDQSIQCAVTTSSEYGAIPRGYILIPFHIDGTASMPYMAWIATSFPSWMSLGTSCAVWVP